MDTKDVSFLSGQLRTPEGDLIKFEFAVDNGGEVRVAESKEGAPGSAIDYEALHTASGIFGAKMRELLIGGTNLFTQARLFSSVIKPTESK